MKFKIPKGTQVLVATDNSTTVNYPLRTHVMKHDLVLQHEAFYYDGLHQHIEPKLAPAGPARFFYSESWGVLIPGLSKTSDISPSDLHKAEHMVFFTKNLFHPFIICASPLVEIIDE